MELPFLIAAQRAHFQSGATLPLHARQKALLALRHTVTLHQTDIAQALSLDLNKSSHETYLTEVGLVLGELRCLLQELPKLAAPQRVKTPLAQFPARSRILRAPFGVTLIMSPWNSPFLLTLQPLAAALAAGNTAVLKPSAYAPASAALLSRMIEESFDPRLVTVVKGGREQNAALLEQRYDMIFFTGGQTVGRLVLERAARHLTPVVLELGGKSPVYVDASANLRLAARRIVFGKLLNAGQTCVAPDYVLAHEAVKDALLPLLKEEFSRQTGGAPFGRDYPRIVNAKHAARLRGLLEGQRIYSGGLWEELRLSPTLVDAPDPASPLMKEEIFGPILPVLSCSGEEEACAFVSARPAPLAFYLFSEDRAQIERMTTKLSFGGGCVNDTVVHLASHRLPFGGVGESGMGSYHGAAGFAAFSRPKSLVESATLLDLPLRYQPYSPFKSRLIRRFLR